MTALLLEIGRWITNPRYFVIEELLLVALLAVALVAPWLGASRWSRWEAALRRLARRPALACLAAALAPVLLRIALLPLFPVPAPEIHDEFSLLLGADTFAKGRLTNPPHPLWMHFESFYLFHQPSYMTMYPPAQSLILALGQVLGHPWIGVLLSVALMCAGITWMLQAWLPPGWAFLGGMIAGLRYGLFSYWMNSYWGGPLAALGGALVVGALGRILRRDPRLGRQAAWMAAGAAILANRRPYEGLVLCVAVAALLLWKLPWRLTLRKLAPAMLAVLVPVAAWMGYYHWRVTGDPLRVPYVHGIESYSIIRHLVLTPMAEEPAYRHAAMRDFFRWEVLQYHARRDRFWSTTKDHLVAHWRFYLGPTLSVALLGLPWLTRDRRMRPLVWIAATGLLALSLEIWPFPHYAAPWTAVAIALLVQMLRHLHAWRRQTRAGAAVLRATVAAGLLALLIPPASRLSGIQPDPTLNGWWVVKNPWERHEVAARLNAKPGKHLVLVRYLPGRDMHREWVYNGAEIDAAPIVWTREMDTAANLRLLDYYGDRQVWLVEVGFQWARLSPYPASATAVASGPPSASR